MKGKTVLLAEVEASTDLLCGSKKSGEYFLREGTSSSRLSAEEFWFHAQALTGEILRPRLAPSTLPPPNGGVRIDFAAHNLGNRPALGVFLMVEVAWAEGSRPQRIDALGFTEDLPGMVQVNLPGKGATDVPTQKWTLPFVAPIYPTLIATVGTLVFHGISSASVLAVVVQVFSERGLAKHHFRLLPATADPSAGPIADELPSTMPWQSYE